MLHKWERKASTSGKGKEWKMKRLERRGEGG
jgi:hypothetical protein